SNNDTFVVARSQGSLGYLFALDYNDGDVDLGWAEGLTFTPLAISINNPDWFVSTDSYVLELLAYGSDLRGRVFDMGGDLLAEMTASDSTLTSGLSGVGTAINNDSQLAD